MKAWEVRTGALGLREVSLAAPRGSQTIVHVGHAGICGSDLPKLLSPRSFSLPDPWRPGHEITGTDPAGRIVAIDPLLPCATCVSCVTGDTHLCASLRRIGWDMPGGLAEQVTVPAANIHPVPEGVDPAIAVLADPAAVAIHGLRCNQALPPGRLAVIGAGVVGLLTALYADRQGWAVTVTHRHGRPPHPAVADAFPAAFRSASMQQGGAFDLVVDSATGASAAPLKLALRLVRDGGTIIAQNAYHPGVQMPVPLRDLFRRSVRLAGSFSHCRRDPGDYLLALQLLRAHTAAASHLIIDAGELAALPDAIRRRPDHPGRRVLTVLPSPRT